MKQSFRLFGLILAMLLLVTACDAGEQASNTSNNNGVSIPANAIQISIIFAPESNRYLPETIEEFNRAYADGTNPVTGAPLADGERPIYVTGEPGSSGTIMQYIVNSVNGMSGDNTAQPVIFAPSVSHWLALANFQSSREIFDLADARATALAPVVMAIWESRYDAIRQTISDRDGVPFEEVEIGWSDLLDVLDSSNGWQDFGIPDGRRTVYYGHTDPFISSTALSTLIAEFYAASRSTGFDGRRIGLEQVNDPEVQQGVREIEELIRHYSRRTTEFIEYIAQGPEYLDFVALEENDLIAINLGETSTSPPEPLVALYPAEGTFWHEHPFGIVNATWVTSEQQDAARVFTDYVLTPAVQQRIMAEGFRPANNEVTLDYPFVAENGVRPEGPPQLLDVPAPEVIASIQESWAFVKKQADIWLVIDISGSMNNENKLEQAQQAALAFLDNMESTNRIGLAVFSNDVQILVELSEFESNEAELRVAIDGLEAEGNTFLYQAIIDVLDLARQGEGDNRIRAVVVLSDGEDSRQGPTLNDVNQAIASSQNDLNPIIVIPVAYGEGAVTPEATRALTSIARESNTRVQSGAPEDIESLFELLSSYF